MVNASAMGRRRAVITSLEDHPNLPEILGVLAQLPHIADHDLPQLADAWHNTVAVADARAHALLPDSPLVLEVLACFEAVVALFDDDLTGDADYITVPTDVTNTALKAVRDAIAAAYARPLLTRSEYVALMAPWRSVYPLQNFEEPDLGPNADLIKAVLTAMPQLSQRCHDAESRRLYDRMVFTAMSLESTMRESARREAWRAAILTARRRVWLMVRRSATEAISRPCLQCGRHDDLGTEDVVLELCLDAAYGLLVADAIDDTLTDVLTMPLTDLVPLQRQAPPV
ncbi:MAG: hypothetical protein QOG52_2080 [Frankiaceae bacterium]|nr:hypothetical protein [Frankiaceae bacterium]